MLATLKPDLIISQVFPWRIPTEVLTLPRLGVVNLHRGLLPEQRGTDTFLWMLREGASETGLTMHRVAADFDTGPLLAQERVPLDDDGDQDIIIGKLSGVLPALWGTAFPRIARGDTGEPQDEARARYLTRIPDEASWKASDWSQPARTVHNIVRASDFTRALPPGAIGTIDGVPHRITKTRLLPNATTAAAPGTVVGTEGEMLLIQCGDGPLGIIAAAPLA